MELLDRRTFLRAGASAVGLTVGSTSAVAAGRTGADTDGSTSQSEGAQETSTSTLNEPPEPSIAASFGLDGESERTLAISIGAFVGGWAAFLWALRKSSEDS